MTFAVVSAWRCCRWRRRCRPSRCSPRPPPLSAGARRPAAPAALPQPSAASDAAATPAEREGKLLKAAAAELRELSPWTMFKSADVVVKAVMIGLAFASLVTWTIFIAKMIELAVVQRKVRSALVKIADARSLAEAQFALGAKGSVLASFLAAAMREARLSPASPATRIKNAPLRTLRNRAREARRIRLGMASGNHRRDVALRRTVRTVWGIMNSFIVFRNRRPRPCRVGARHAEALLATAIVWSLRSPPSSSTITSRGYQAT